MRKFLRKALFNNQPVKQYLTICIDRDVVLEQAFLWVDNKKTNVSNEQFILCQRPFIVGIWMGKKNELTSDLCQLDFTNKVGKKLIQIKLRRIRTVDFQQGKFILFTFVRSQYFFISSLHQKALMFFFFTRKDNRIKLRELDCFCAAYSYPRKVILTCFREEEYYNIFPMDFQGLIQEARLYVLGLRNTNVTLKKILESKKVVVCEIPASEKELIIRLGNHHSSAPPDLEELPFLTETTALYKTPIPRMAKSYRELEIVYSSDEGSHTIMIAKIVNHSQNETDFCSLFHWHIASAIKGNSNYAVV